MRGLDLRHNRHEAQKVGGHIAGQVLLETVKRIKPGISTLELDTFAEKRIRELGGAPSFKGYDGYPFTTCINLNEGVVHGLPSEKIRIKEGDLVTVDLGVYYKNYHTDTATTIEVAGSTAASFLAVGREALSQAIKVCLVGNRVGDIGAKIQQVIEGDGYYVIRELVGHGVGRELHESPSVPGYGHAGQGAVLSVGQTIAVEVIYAENKTRVTELSDGWTIVTKNGSKAAVFEHTVEVAESGPIVLTAVDF